MFDTITVVVYKDGDPLQMVPRKVGLGVGDTAVQSNDDDTDEGSVPPLYETPAGTLTEVSAKS